MRWPRLVMGFTQSTPVTVTVDVDGIDEDGAPIVGSSWSGACNWQDRTREVYSRDLAETEVNATVYIDGDPFPGLSVIAGGTVSAFNDEREIVQGMKARNPDGTVNYTRLDLR